MKQEELSAMSLDDLKKKAKTLKFTAGLLLGMVLTMAVIGIYLYLERGFSATTVLPIAFMPMVIIFLSMHKAVQTEIAKREQS